MTKIKAFFKRHKKLLLILLLVVAILFILRSVFANRDKGQVLAKAETTELKKKNFENSVRETGEAVSEDSVTIFAEKQLPVKEISVEVGDEVKKDQIIAKLDDSSIRQQIAQKQAAIAASSSSSAAQIKNAKNRLADANKNLEKGTNSSLVAANNAVISAYDQWQSAEKTYDDYQRSISAGYNDQIVQQDSSQKTLEDGLNSAQLNLDQANRKYSKLQEDISSARSKLSSASAQIDRLKTDQDYLNRRISDLSLEKENLERQAQASNIPASPGANPQDPGGQNNSEILEKSRELSNLQNELKKVTENLASAQANVSKYEGEIEAGEKQLDSSKMEIEQQSLALNKAKSDQEAGRVQKEKSQLTRKDQLEVYRKNAQDLKSAYESALKNLASAEEAAKDEISSLKNNLSIAQSSANSAVDSTDLKFLYEDLEKTVIKAPMDGTITQINVEEGQAPADYLAKVDTVDRVVVKTKVKEFDVNKLKLGMETEITSDALGSSKVFHGKVESINPTPISADPKGQAGQKSNEVYYEVKVSLEDDKENQIKPGMSLKVKYVFEKKENVYIAPMAAIYQKNDKDFVLYLSKDALNKPSTIKEMPVIIRDRNDYEAVITSEEDLKGIKIINSPDKYSAGMEVTLTEDSSGD